MNKHASTLFLKALDASPKENKRTGWVISDCPLAPWRHEDGKSGKEVFGLKIGSGLTHCSCFACGFNGDQRDLLTEVQFREKAKPSGRAYDFKTAVQLVATAEDEFELDLDTPDVEEMLFGGKAEGLHIFDTDWIESFPLASHTPFAREYLLERNIPEPLWSVLELRADTNQKRVCFPVKDFSQRYVGLHGRAIFDGIEPRYRMYTHKNKNNPICWLGEDRVDFSRPVVAAEGPFDMAAIMRVYDNVVSPLFANPSIAKLKRMGNAFEMVTFLDRGKAGDMGRERFEEVFGKYHMLNHAKPPAHRKDAGVMTDDEIREELAKFIPSLE